MPVYAQRSGGGQALEQLEGYTPPPMFGGADEAANERNRTGVFISPFPLQTQGKNASVSAPKTDNSSRFPAPVSDISGAVPPAVPVEPVEVSSPLIIIDPGFQRPAPISSGNHARAEPVRSAHPPLPRRRPQVVKVPQSIINEMRAKHGLEPRQAPQGNSAKARSAAGSYDYQDFADDGLQLAQPGVLDVLASIDPSASMPLKRAMVKYKQGELQAEDAALSAFVRQVGANPQQFSRVEVYSHTFGGEGGVKALTTIATARAEEIKEILLAQGVRANVVEIFPVVNGKAEATDYIEVLFIP